MTISDATTFTLADDPYAALLAAVSAAPRAISPEPARPQRGISRLE